MSVVRRLSCWPLILVLIAAFGLSPALETHEPRGHLADRGGFEESAVYVAGHERIDDTLHIELLGSVELVHCAGCLLRQTRSGMVAPRQLTTRAPFAAAASVASADELPRDPTRFSGPPRAPPRYSSASS